MQIVYVAPEQEAKAREIGLNYEVDPTLLSGEWQVSNPSSANINVVYLNHHLSGMYPVA